MARLHEALPRDLYDAFAACCTAATAAAAIHRDSENFMKFHAKDGEPISLSTATAIFARSVVTLRDKLRRAYEAFDLVESDLYIADGETCAHADAICYSQQVHSAVILIPDLLKAGFDPDVVGQQISKFWVSVWASLCSIKPIDLWQLGEKCKKEAASAAFRRKSAKHNDRVGPPAAEKSVWLHDAGSEPPQDFYVEKWLTGTQTQVGFAIRHENYDPVTSDRAHRDYLKSAASGKLPRVWCRVAVKPNIDVFFRDAKSLHDAEAQLKKYRRRKPKEVGGSPRKPLRRKSR